MAKQSRAAYLAAQRDLEALATLASDENPDGTPFGLTTGGGGDASAANQVITNTEIGATNETAPASDTAASGLNGRLQRIAQNITTLIARFVLDSTDRIRVSLYGKSSAAGDTPLLVDSAGRAIVSLASTDLTTDVNQVAYMTASSGVRVPATAGLVWNGTTWPRQRTPAVFVPVALVAGTAETTLWTPAAGKKFRLMGFMLTCGAASTLTFKDNTAGSTIFAARGATDTPIAPAGMGNGILSSAINQPLTVIRGTSCTLDGVVWGTEE